MATVMYFFFKSQAFDWSKVHSASKLTSQVNEMSLNSENFFKLVIVTAIY